MLGKDVQNQAGAIQNLDIIPEGVLQIPQLPGGKLFVKHEHVPTEVMPEIDQLLNLSRSNKSRRLKSVHPLPGLPRDLETGSPRKLAQLDQRILNIPAISMSLQLGANQQRPFRWKISLDQLPSNDSPRFHLQASLKCPRGL
jgi:hypothetical protein